MEVPKNLMRINKGKKDKQTLADFSSAHRLSQAKYQSN